MYVRLGTHFSGSVTKLNSLELINSAEVHTASKLNFYSFKKTSPNMSILGKQSILSARYLGFRVKKSEQKLISVMYSFLM